MPIKITRRRANAWSPASTAFGPGSELVGEKCTIPSGNGLAWTCLPQALEGAPPRRRWCQDGREGIPVLAVSQPACRRQAAGSTWRGVKLHQGSGACLHDISPGDCRTEKRRAEFPCGPRTASAAFHSRAQEWLWWGYGGLTRAWHSRRSMGQCPTASVRCLGCTLPRRSVKLWSLLGPTGAPREIGNDAARLLVTNSWQLATHWRYIPSVRTRRCQLACYHGFRGKLAEAAELRFEL